ncbi:DUF4179 domain-containing protein [uncultured Clostridium sp.]|uniref:DUF4179 domain-containing protein n=1 Tax=uncultured Clostridium sp. TaxID=59620 RepID=UPI0028F10DAA|nr:DUF4179 domain-containing protein [uncultured Clostridium sp.]
MSKINEHDNDVIYDILNYVNIEEDYDENFQLDQITSKRIKNNINKKLKGNKRRKKYFVASLLLMGLGAFAIINPTLASNIQNSIIQTMQVLRGDYVNYKKYTTNVNLSSSNKGIEFKVNEIVSDNNIIMISYSIISDEKMDNPPRIDMMEIEINRESAGNGGSGRLVNDNRYDGVLEVNMMRRNIPDTFYLSIKTSSINNIKGKWNFNIKVNKSEIQKETKDYIINKNINIGAEEIFIKRVSISPISTSMEFNGSVGEHHYFLLDDKGNEIIARGSSGNGFEGEMHYNSLVNKDAKYLTFIPFDYKGSYISEPKTYNIDKLPLELPVGDFGKLIVKDIEWDNDTLKVSYVSEGKFPVTLSAALRLFDEEGNRVDYESKTLGFQKDPSNQHEFEQYFKGVSKDKNYKLGAIRLDEIYKVNEAYKFNIELK